MVQMQDQTDALLEMMEDALDDNPEAVKVGDVVNTDLSQTFPAAISEISHRDPETDQVIPGNGFRWFFDTRTGEPRRIHRHHWKTVREKKYTDSDYPEWIGKPAFSLVKTKEFILGTSLCYLHPHHPDKWTERIRGLRPCMSSHLANDYEADRHSRLAHKSEWAAIENLREREERAEDREIQRRSVETNEALVRNLTDQNGSNGAPGNEGILQNAKHNHGAPWNRIVEGCPKCKTT